MTTDAEHRKTSDIMRSLNRDCLWLERELRRIARATAVNNPDKLRMIAAEAVEKAKARRKRTMTR